MRYHVQWARVQMWVQVSGSQALLHRFPRQVGNSRRRKHGKCNGECLQQHVCFAERKDRWMNRPTHRQLYVGPRVPWHCWVVQVAVNWTSWCLFDHRFVRSKVISAWYSECRTPNTQTTLPRCHMIWICQSPIFGSCVTLNYQCSK